jgi:hypothetical protein
MSGRKANPCYSCGWKPARRSHRTDRPAPTAIGAVERIEIVHLLAARPELRDLFPLAEQIDQAVRWGI